MSRPQLWLVPALTIRHRPSPASSRTKSRGPTEPSATQAAAIRTATAKATLNARIQVMKNDSPPEVPAPVAEDRQMRGDVRRAIFFGVAMATIQMGILLYFLYC